MPPDATRPRGAARATLAGRLRLIREEAFGEDGIAGLASRLGVPGLTWRNYESGVTIPGDVLLRFVEATSAEPRWLLTGQGPRSRGRPGVSTPPTSTTGG